MELFLVILLIVVLALVRARWNSPAAIGARGESKVRKRLKRRLSKNEYEFFHDVTLPSVMGSTQIDHIVLSQYGVFVIETKNYSGWIFGSAKSKQWTQAIYRTKSRFQNPLHQNYKHVKAVQSFLLLDPAQIHSVVVFTGNSQFKTGLPPNVTDLAGLCPYIRSKREVIFEPRRLEELVVRLLKFKAGLVPERHDASLIRIEPDCPRCGAPMVQRRAKTGKNAGNNFWGCSKFPRCRGTQKMATIDE